VLVVGAGSAGCAVAGFLARSGVTVDVVEIHPDVTALGSGITVQGNALRVLRQFGVWDQVEAAGFGFGVTGIRSHDGTLLTTLEDLRTGGPDLPATMGMERAKLAAILVDGARRHGANLRFGCTITSLVDDGDGVDVEFSDGSGARYDMVVGADGLRSSVRSLLGITTVPAPTGMGIWRVFTSRPEEITRTDLCFDGPCYIAGFCPTGPDSLYAYLVEDRHDRSTMSPDEQLAYMRQLSESYRGPWDAIRQRMTDPESIHYTWFEWMLLDRPWYVGRVVLIGDSAHNCPPTLAQGAAQALEDALVLSESLITHEALDVALESFMDRRFRRARTVVEASVQIGKWMLDHDPAADIPGTMGRTLMMLCEPA
jgi:2-polyprenyl-6-methoxyphenol hydroxylase-like FAD-dependent oxidoreductase